MRVCVTRQFILHSKAITECEIDIFFLCVHTNSQSSLIHDALEAHICRLSSKPCVVSETAFRNQFVWPQMIFVRELPHTPKNPFIFLFLLPEIYMLFGSDRLSGLAQKKMAFILWKRETARAEERASVRDRVKNVVVENINCHLNYGWRVFVRREAFVRRHGTGEVIAQYVHQRNSRFIS